MSGTCGYGPKVKAATKSIERARAKAAIRRGDDLPTKEAI